MAKLPMVELVHRRDPSNRRKINQREYALAPERWRDFKIVTFLRQEADPDVVEQAVKEWEVNERRLEERDAKKDWEFTSKQSDHNVVTETTAEPMPVAGPAPKRRGRPPKAKA